MSRYKIFVKWLEDEDSGVQVDESPFKWWAKLYVWSMNSYEDRAGKVAHYFVLDSKKNKVVT